MTTEILGSAATVPAAWIPDDGTFGARLALIRQRMAWGNVKEAAMACGIPAESWRTWERDNVNPRDYQQVCRRIAEHTGVHLGWLMGGQALGGGLVRANHAPADRPRDNRPVGRPRTGDGARAVRRPQRLRPAGSMASTRRAA